MAYTKVIDKCFGDPAIHELQVGEAVTPGHLVEVIAGPKIQKHSTAGGKCTKSFAIEQTGIGNTIATASGATDFIPFVVARPGDIIIGRLKASENVSVGDWVESAGDGTLRKLVADTSAGTIVVGSLIGQVLAASNTSSVVLIPVLIC